MNIRNFIKDYKGHNRYGMLIRFFMFYLMIPSAVLTYQRGNNINHDDIKNISDLVLYLGFMNDGFIIISMIMSFIIIDIQEEEKILVKKKNKKSINMNSVENTKLLEDSKESEIFTLNFPKNLSFINIAFECSYRNIVINNVYMKGYRQNR